MSGIWDEDHGHVWELDENGDMKDFDFGEYEDFHHGPKCTKCHLIFCSLCVEGEVLDKCEAK